MFIVPGWLKSFIIRKPDGGWAWKFTFLVPYFLKNLSPVTVLV